MAARRAAPTRSKSPTPRQVAGRARAGGPAARPRRRDARLAFEALSIEGGLLLPDWLARVAALEAGGQTEADYRVPKGLQLRDEIGRYWRIAQAQWGDFAAGRASATTPEAARALAKRFVVPLLRESFGFASLAPAEPVAIAERRYPIGFAALGGRVPVVIAPAASGLDTLAATFGDGGRRRSAFGLAQEFLNAADGATWGLASDGLALRILRDNASLTRPSWIGVNLERIFTEERYPDFAALWLLAHETRFGREDHPPTECPLESWRDAGREEGTRAREHLRRGVEEALEALGQGFLAHPDNGALRAALQSGALSTTAYFQELLRLVYRLIFLLTVEERGLLHPDGAPEAARRLYAEGYALRRLRERAVRRSAHDRFSDLSEAAKIVFRGLATGEPRLGLPALAGLFAPHQTPALDAAKLENRFLLLAVFRLSWLREMSGLARVNWRDMGPEELGSVYESLLELVPQVTQDGRAFRFASGGETKGNARKTSGSYYTPDSLVQVLLDSALEPVVASTLAANPERPVEALLELSVVDPACGSGHFLLAAARRLAAHVARLEANGTPSAAEYRHALRQVVGRCLYGVDLNPMAVELCKVSLWMEAVEPGLPLTFLDAHIRDGNALLGTTPELMANGVPDAAWEPIEGDDRKVASALKKRNKKAAGGQRALDTLWTKPDESEADAVARAVTELDSAPDADIEALARKEGRWERILESEEYRHQKLVADTWCAAFVWPKQPGTFADAAPTNDLWLQIRDRKGQPPPLTVTTVKKLAEQYRFFHWHLAFPQVFARGEFDVVLGNPPWDQLQFREQEFFAPRHKGIAEAPTETARKRMIYDLSSSDPRLLADYRQSLRANSGERSFALTSGRYPLGARGRVNTYLLFVELASDVGRYVGLIAPTGVATDESGRLLFSHLFSGGRVRMLWDFENRQRLFPEVDGRARFALLSISEAAPLPADFCFGLHAVSDASEQKRHFTLTVNELTLLNPNTSTCPSFLSRRDAELVKHIHERIPVLLKENNEAASSGSWNVATKPGLLNMATDSGLFAGPDGDKSHLPVYEGKMFGLYDHRAADVVVSESATIRQGQSDDIDDEEHGDPYRYARPRHWVPRAEIERRILGQWDRDWLPGWKEITSPTNARTLIPAVLPLSGIGHKIPVFLPPAEVRDLSFALIANMASFVCDYVCRNKLNGTSLTPFTVKQLPVLPPATYTAEAPWDPGVTLRDWLLPRVLELTYTAWDLQPFARDIGYEGPPFRWNPERRFLLRADIDAAFFHLYSLSPDDTAYILDSFLTVRKNDKKAHGDYRTKRVILDIYDDMAEAARTGTPYATRLDPAPADPRVAHPPRTGIVVSFPSPAFVPRPLPSWSPELFTEAVRLAQVTLDAGAWGTSLSGENLGTAALAAVLRNLPGPRGREEVERAVVLALLPRLMQPNFDSTLAGTWRTLIGRENLAATSVSAFGIPWSVVIRKAVQQNVLSEDPGGFWRPGADVALAPSPALDARALVALAWLATAPAEDAEVTRQMGDLRAA
jgi:hypothetical protein